MAHNWTESHQWSTHQTSQCRIRGCVWVRGACHGPSRWPAVKVTLPLTVTAERSAPSDRVSCQQPERWRKSDHPDRLRRRDEGADGQDAHRVTAWLTVVASSAQSAAEHGVCLDLLSFVFPPRFPAWRCVPCSVWLRQTPEQTVWTESEILRLRHPNPAVSRQIQMNLPRTRLHGPWRLILRQILGILLRYGGLGGGDGWFAALHTCQIIPWPPVSHPSCLSPGPHSSPVSTAASKTFQMTVPLHAAASNLTRRPFRQPGKSSQHEIRPTANNWHTESIRTTVWQICFSVNATCQWWIVSATKPFFKWIQQLGFGPHVNSFDKCILQCLSSFCSIIFMLKWSNLFLRAQSVGVDYPSRWCPPR